MRPCKFGRVGRLYGPATYVSSLKIAHNVNKWETILRDV